MPSINYKVTIIKHHLSPSLMSYSEERIKRIKTGFGSCWFEPCEPHVVQNLVCLTGISFLFNKIFIYLADKRFLELIVFYEFIEITILMERKWHIHEQEQNYISVR